MPMLFEFDMGDRSEIFESLARLLMGGSTDPKTAHINVVERIMKHPTIAAMEPRSKRTATKINDDQLVISSEGFSEDDPHMLVLLRNPKKLDRWIFYNLCPRNPDQVTGYRLQGDSDTVIRQASVLLDIVLNIIDQDELPEDLWKKPKPEQAKE